MQTFPRIFGGHDCSVHPLFDEPWTVPPLVTFWCVSLVCFVCCQICYFNVDPGCDPFTKFHSRTLFSFPFDLPLPLHLPCCRYEPQRPTHSEDKVDDVGHEGQIYEDWEYGGIQCCHATTDQAEDQQR